jgi:hypothetical protein
MIKDFREDLPREKAGMPRWVRGFVAAGLALVLIAIAMVVSGHGPGRHFTTEAHVSQ